MSDAAVINDGKITCRIDGARVHSIRYHINKVLNDPAWTVERYEKEFPGEPLLSEFAKQQLAKKQLQKAAQPGTDGVRRAAMSDVFGIPAQKAINARGQPIMVRVFSKDDVGEEAAIWVPDIDTNYVFPIELTRTVLASYELNRRLYLWGFHGTGKTTLAEQCAARTGRPFVRVQHTINMEESHVIGQWTVKTKIVENQPISVTEFELGPLPVAMINGWVYCADEYDRAIAPVISLYQAVLEGKPLIIKEAPPELRMIRPHPDFRFVATGNTNGSGDETGLYQGTQVQDAANYSRFSITEEVHYPERAVEVAIVASQAQIRKDEAEKLVEFATMWRERFAAKEVSITTSTRELIEAGKNALIRGGDFKFGLCQAFINRLSRTDKVVAEQAAQRIFG